MRFDIDSSEIIEIIRTAANITEWCRKKLHTVYQKTHDKKNPVTWADYGSQAWILGQLKKKYPHDRFYAEENLNEAEKLDALNPESHLTQCFKEIGQDLKQNWENAKNQTESNSGREWIIDPVDGTKAFTENKNYTIGIALVIDRHPVFSAIGIPNHHKHPLAIYLATKNEGASVTFDGLQFHSLHVNSSSNLSQSILVHSKNNNTPLIDEMCNHLHIHNRQIIDGSLYKMVKIVDGSADFYIRPTPQVTVDAESYCAGDLLISEAGGNVTNFNGETLHYEGSQCILGTPGLIASNSAIHTQIIQHIQSFKHLW